MLRSPLYSAPFWWSRTIALIVGGVLTLCIIGSLFWIWLYYIRDQPRQEALTLEEGMRLKAELPYPALMVYIDPGTGCQYLAMPQANGSGLTPRMVRPPAPKAGVAPPPAVHMCSKNPKEQP